MTAQPRRATERGLTLTELTIAIVLSSIVTVGLITFYVNSQGIWFDGSTQVLAQRDATTLADLVTSRARRSTVAAVFASPDSLHQGLILFDPLGGETHIRWSATDSLVHVDTVIAGLPVDQGPPVLCKVSRFQLDRNDSLVYIRMLETQGTTGMPIRLSSVAVLNNR